MTTKFSQVGFPAEKIAVLPNFLDFDPLDTPSEPGDYAVFIGRLSEEKGLFTLLKAIDGLPEIPLKILGEGPLGPKLKEFARSRQMDRVEFTGFIDGEAKQEILGRARALIFPSECYESFGYSIIESHACGVPVIASAIGGAKELIHEGRNGFLFEPGNHLHLRKQISLLWGDQTNVSIMKENALKGVKELYTREKGYRDLLALFEDVAAGSKT